VMVKRIILFIGCDLIDESKINIPGKVLNQE
jgi:hypothetical protein